MESLPLVTVIVTTYNYAHTLGMAIDSALAQDYPNLEVLVVDNASTDATPELAARYAGDARFRYIRNASNIGMVPNHNKGLREARGEYVLFLSADDFLLPGHLLRSYRFLRDNPATDVLYTSTYFVNEQAGFIGVRQMSGQPFGAYTGGRNELAGLLTEGCYICFPTMLMRRELFARFGELDEAIKAADYEIVLRWAANGVTFAYLPEPTCAVRLHSAQQSSPQNYVADAGDIREFLYLVDKYAEPFGAQLDGFESGVSRHLWNRFEMARGSGVADADGELRRALLAADGVLARVRDRNAARIRLPRPTILVLPTTAIGALERTLRSLVAQTHAGWDALVLSDSGHDFAPMGAHLDPARRIRGVRFIGMVGEAQTINTGLRIAGGDAFIVMRAGTELPPDHLERVLAPLTSGAFAVRTPAELVVHTTGADGAYHEQRYTGLFMPPNESRLNLVAPFGPVEALAFTRTAVDRVLPFNDRLPAFTAWEFLLRVQMQLQVAAVDSPVVVHAVAGTAESYEQCAALPGIARAIHAAYGTEDRALLIERDAYLRNLQSALDRGPAAASTASGIAQLLGVAGGTDLLAGVR